MRNIYLFLLLIPFSFAFGQNIAQNGGMENWTDGVLDVWTSEDGTVITQESTIVSEGSSAAKFQVITATQGNTDFRQNVAVEIGKTYEITVDVYQLDNASKTRIYGTDWGTYSDPALVDEWQTIAYEFTASETGSVPVGLRFYDEADVFDAEVGAFVIIDNYTVTCLDCATTSPEIFISSPSEGEVLAAGTTETTVDFVVNNFEVGTDGNVHYSLNDGAAETLYSTDAFTLSGLTSGSHTLNMWLVDAENNALNPEVSATVNFSIPGQNEVSSIAELRAGATDGSIYTLTSEAVITMQQDFRGQKWIQDATGAILIDDNDGVISTAYNQYDGVSGLQGTLSVFRGLMQFIPTADVGVVTSTANEVMPLVVTVEELNANIGAYESQLIKVENVSTEATGDWSSGSNYDFMQTGSAENLIVRTNFYDADYIGTALPEGTVHLVGIASRFNDDAQIFPRDSEDIIDNLSVRNPDFNTALVKVAVANGELRVAGFDVKDIAIYNTNGQLVGTSKAVGSLPVGTYIAVMRNAEGQVVNVKFIKK